MKYTDLSRLAARHVPQSVTNRARRFVGNRAQLLAVSAAAFGVIATGSLLQATHGSDAYAQTASASAATYRSGYVIHENGQQKTRGSGSSSAAAGSKTAGVVGTSAGASGSGTTSGGAATAAGPAAVSGAAAGSTTVSTTPKARTPAPAQAPAPAAPPAGSWKYPLHTGIKTTWFYAGEPASADNDFIQNVSSAWQEDWQGYFGGSDNPASRCGYNPCAFTPRENPFYFALPFSDYTGSGPVADLSMVYWFNPAGGQLQDGQSILKNHWIQITAAPDGVSKTVYAQWEDVGPFKEHDSAYVFGSSAPQSARAGLDVSPAARDYLGQTFKDSGSTISSWRFVDASEVPAGPWKNTITTSAPDWN